jgi:uroporphyrinogen III methyltransferase/synthase
MKVLTVATRRGELAIAQTRLVIAALKARCPEVEIRIQEIISAGDRDRKTALWDLKDTGFFTSQLEDALLAGEADLAVHSFKDLPTTERAGLAVTAICDRKWPEDCLLCRVGRAHQTSGETVGSAHPTIVDVLACLPAHAKVGTSSLRRAAQLRRIRPDLVLVPLRGNVQTRIHKLQTEDLDAIILARAGLERLGLTDAISVVFDPKEFVPAPAQGTLAIETRSDDEWTVEIVRSIDDELSRALALAERQVLATTQCGCHAPVGAYAERQGDTIEVHAFISDVDGRNMVRKQAQGPLSQAVQVGERVALELLDAGGRQILRDLERDRRQGDSGRVGSAHHSPSKENGAKKPKVYLVGAGPGRADLITLRGAELLKIADCIIMDKLANPALLELARKDAEIVHVPKRIGPGSFTQDQVNQILVDKALEGKTVVRLKGGDPCIFGRCTEEALLLNAAGVEFEIVPGITAAIAAAEYSGIMLTDRRYSSQVAFITGREAEGKEQTNLDWDVLARFPGTLVFYMGIGALPSIVKRLTDSGLSSDTPAALVADATLPTQRLVQAPLGRIAKECERQQIEPPALVMVGPAAAGDAGLNWFMRRPLFGKGLVITRDPDGNADSARKIIARGGRPVEYPTLAIQPLTNRSEFLRVLAEFPGYAWVVFTSANGVRIFFDVLRELGKDARVFGGRKIAAIGPITADSLESFGIRADFVPEVFTGRELARQLIGYTDLRDKKVLLLRSEIASDELVEALETGGAAVTDVAVYTAVSHKGDHAALVGQMQQGKIQWLTFASPSAVRAFFEQIPPEAVHSYEIKVASVGPVTSKELIQCGVRVDVEAKEHTIDGLLDAIEVASSK